MVSHSIEQDNNKSTSVEFKDNETVTLEFDPSTGKLTYKNGKFCLEQQTGITKSTTHPVHFCVAMWNGRVQIVPQ